MHKNKKILCKIKDFPFNYFLSVKFPSNFHFMSRIIKEKKLKKSIDKRHKRCYNPEFDTWQNDKRTKALYLQGIRSFFDCNFFCVMSNCLRNLYNFFHIF